MAPERIAKVRLAGLLHDVGKIGIADAILQNEGHLSKAEYAVLKTHSTLGAAILRAAEEDDEALWILHHHERPDGTGYPDGLSGALIPLESRIMAVADAFEAMTADRPHRRSATVQAALVEIDRHAGSQFDPWCIAALRRVVEAPPAESAAHEPVGPAAVMPVAA